MGEFSFITLSRELERKLRNSKDNFQVEVDIKPRDEVDVEIIRDKIQDVLDNYGLDSWRRETRDLKIAFAKNVATFYLPKYVIYEIARFREVKSIDFFKELFYYPTREQCENSLNNN